MSVRSAGKPPIASTTDAQTATRNDVYMTPATTAAEIAALASNSSTNTTITKTSNTLTRGKAVALSRQ